MKFDLDGGGGRGTCVAAHLSRRDEAARVAQATLAWAGRVDILVNNAGQPDELVGPPLPLASEAGSFITGATLVVDGGYLAK